jgi:uncharacterized protein (TIRG00374 family)
MTVSAHDRRLPPDETPLPANERGGNEDAPQQAPAAATRKIGWGKGLLLSLVAAFAVLTGLGLYGDFADVSSTLAAFRWNLIPALLGLTTLNYLVRYLRWRRLLHLTGTRTPRLLHDVLIFLAGTAMILTPGRAGEWLKSYYLRDMYGVPVARTAPIILVERVSDSLAMLLLAATGFFLFGRGGAVLLIVIVVAMAAIVGLRHRGFASLVLRGVRRLPAAHRLLPPIEDFHESSRILFSLSGLSWSCGLGLLAWALECLTFFLVLVGFGKPMTWTLVAQAAFIFPIATLAGSLSLLPAGIGVTEGSMTGMTQAILAVPRSLGVASALLVRATILGFAFALGLVAFALLEWSPLRQAEGSSAQPTARQREFEAGRLRTAD